MREHDRSVYREREGKACVRSFRDKADKEEGHHTIQVPGGVSMRHYRGHHISDSGARNRFYSLRFNTTSSAGVSWERDGYPALDVRCVLLRWCAYRRVLALDTCRRHPCTVWRESDVCDRPASGINSIK